MAEIGIRRNDHGEPCSDGSAEQYAVSQSEPTLPVNGDYVEAAQFIRELYR